MPRLAGLILILLGCAASPLAQAPQPEPAHDVSDLAKQTADYRLGLFTDD